METYTENLLSFIENSPTAFHAVENLKKMLTDAGYRELCEHDAWELTPGGRYFVTRNSSAVIAFRIPQTKNPPRFMIAAAHSDSPCFKIKDAPELSDSLYTRLSTEKYGGMIHDSWFDRPLSVAGRVLVRTETGISERLLDLASDCLLIPHVAIHMENPNNGKTYNPATDLVPLYGSAAAKGTFLSRIAAAADVDAADILAHDLYLYSREAPMVWGTDGEFLSSPRLDDLQCAYAAVQALIETDEARAIPVAYVADNEEVGSGTRQGAGSTFLSDVLTRICEATGGDLRRAIPESMLVSADNAHAVHPNAPGLADANHRPVMNGGVVVKFSASQSYTTDAVSAAIFREICHRAEVPVQTFFNRSDMRGGSTLGHIAIASVPVMAVDIGAAQLAMHSAYETAGTRDTAHLVGAMRAVYETCLKKCDKNLEII